MAARRNRTSRPAMVSTAVPAHFGPYFPGMTATPHRNDPCPCGSGRKYKNCHAARSSPALSGTSRTILLLIVLAALVVAGLALTRGGGGGAPGPAPPGKVWSAEHGHWHDAP